MKKARLLPVGSYPGYFVSEDGKVYRWDRELKPLVKKGGAARVKLKSESGGWTKVAIAKLVAQSFIPNPKEHTYIIFKDRNKDNNHYSNIAWVSHSQAITCNNYYVESYEELLAIVELPKKEPLFIDPDRVPVEGYPNFFITPTGTIYRGNRIIKPSDKKGHSLKARLWVKKNGERVHSWPGLATLIAQHFIPNPKGHKYIIFKDRNNRNCVRDNIAWVDGETFAWYSGITKQRLGGRKKIVLEREEAIKKCTNIYLKEYYKTGDEEWLKYCWEEMEKKVVHAHWAAHRSDLYLYFFDRAKRFSILGSPLGLLLSHLKSLLAGAYKEFSPHLPTKLLMQTDISLRSNVDNYE